MRHSRIRLGGAIALTIITTAVFIHTLHIRRPFFGELCEGAYEPITGESLKFARNWYLEGAWRLGFLQLLNPCSIEFPSLLSRQVYYTVPPGAIVPIHIVAKALGREPSVAMIHGYNLATQLAVCVMMCLFVYIWLIHCGMTAWLAWLFALPAMFVALLLPGPLYWHQNLYYSDQAVVVWYVAAGFLEMLRDILPGGRAQRWLTFVQCGVTGMGCLTDWSMLFVVAGIYVKRILCGQMGDSVRAFIRHSSILWAAPLGAGLLYSGQLALIGKLQELLARVALYSGCSTTAKLALGDVHRAVWERYIPKAYGRAMVLPLQATVVVLLIGILRWRWRRRATAGAMSIAYCGMFLVPWLLYMYTFRMYTLQHDFSVQKAYVILGIFTFGLLPGLAALLLRRQLLSWQYPARGLVRTLAYIAPVLIGLGAALYTAARVHGMYPARRILFRQPQPTYRTFGDFLRAHTGFSDIVFSPAFEVGEGPAQLVASTMKRVYKYADIFTTYSHCQAGASTGDYVVNLIVPPVSTCDATDIHYLTAAAYTSAVLPSLTWGTNQYHDIRLYKIAKPVFERLAYKHGSERIAYMQRLHQDMRGAPGERRAYLSEDHRLRAENLYAGRYGPFQRGRGHGGEAITFWGFACTHALCMMPGTGPVGRVVADLGGRYATFRCVVGAYDRHATVTMRVIADGRKLFDSGQRTGTDYPLLIDADVRGCRTLELQMLPGVSYWGDHTVWVDPHLVCARPGAQGAQGGVAYATQAVTTCECDAPFLQTLLDGAGTSNALVYSPARDTALCVSQACPMLGVRVYAPRLYDLYYQAYTRPEALARRDEIHIYLDDQPEFLDVNYRDLLATPHAVYALNQRALHVFSSEALGAWCARRFASTRSLVEQLRQRFAALSASNAVYMAELPLLTSNFVYGTHRCVRMREDFYGCPIVLYGFTAAHGLSTHAPAAGTALLAVTLNGTFERFTAIVGITDAETGSARLATQLDDRDVIEYPELQSRGLPLLLDLDVRGVSTFKAYLDNGSNRNPTCDSIVWIDPQFAPALDDVSP